MAAITHLPHIKNTESGVNYADPMGSAVFEVSITLPEAIASSFGDDPTIYMMQQITKVSGLDMLQKTVGAGHQKFFGVDVSFLNPAMDQTYAEINMEFNLNIHKVTDARLFKIFKAWEKLGYDLADGTRTLKADYVGKNVRIAEANRDGTIWRSYVFHDVMITNVTGADTLDYNDNEPRKLTVTFISDYWDEDLG